MMRKFLTLVFSLTVLISCSQPKPATVKMVVVSGGTFTMGSSNVDWNQPRKVALDTFLMARYPVTVGEWKIFLRETGLPFDWDWSEPPMKGTFRDVIPTDDCPAQGFNWYYAVAYCNWLSKREGLTPSYTIQGEITKKSEPEVVWNKKANGYRLPTDAEWEYAARGGQQSKGYRYAGSDNPDEIALYKQAKSYPVGRMKPNELGLYDMTGNVRVWSWDWFDAAPGKWQPEQNPSVDKQSDVRKIDRSNPEPMKVIRGFDWEYRPFDVYLRSHYPPIHISWIGIRLVRSAGK